jgi:glycosyltransferase involved in cell wall biosynthesis
MNTPPLVTAICPTVCPVQDRYALLTKAAQQFLKQDYPNKELLILYATGGGERLLIEAQNVWQVSLIGTETLGEKRNIGCKLAHGEIICHWDDDDWYFPSRITEQTATLFASGADVTGYGRMLFVDPVTQFCARYDTEMPNYAIGNSLMYRKSYWEAHPFPERQIGEDNDFVRMIPEGRMRVENGDQIIARLHDQQTCQRPREVYEHGEPWKVEQWREDLQCV